MTNEELLDCYDKRARDYKKRKYLGPLILFGWTVALAFGFVVWLKGWYIGMDLIYFPRGAACVLSSADLTRFVFTIALFAAVGNLSRNTYNIFVKFWQSEVLKDRFQIAENNKSFYLGRIKDFINSSPTNITLFRPLFFPIISGILAIPIVFLIYGFNADLPRVAIVSFLTGIVANVVLTGLQKKADGFIKAILGLT